MRGERLFVDVELAGRVFATVVEPLRDAAGAISSLIGVSTDVTSERRLEDRAAREQRERAVVELALEGLDPLLGLDDQARAIATELVDLPDVDRVSILGFGPRGLVFVFAAEGLSVPTLTAGVRLPAARARYLRHRARQGAWVEPWLARVECTVPPIDDLVPCRLLATGNQSGLSFCLVTYGPAHKVLASKCGIRQLGRDLASGGSQVPLPITGRVAALIGSTSQPEFVRTASIRHAQIVEPALIFFVLSAIKQRQSKSPPSRISKLENVPIRRQSSARTLRNCRVRPATPDDDLR